MASLKIDNINNEIFKSLKKKTQALKQEQLFVFPPEKFLEKVNFEKSFPLIYRLLTHMYRINVENIEARIFQKNYLGEYKNMCNNEFNNIHNNNIQETDKHEYEHEHEQKQKHQNNITDDPYQNINEKKEDGTIKIENNNTNINTNININNSTYPDILKEKEKQGNDDFLESLVQLKIHIPNTSQQDYIYKHIIELIDSIAAETVYRHCLGTYHENNKYHFVTALFNNLKIYKNSEATAHEFNFSLNPKVLLTINSYIVHAGTTSYILKIDFFQNNELIFDLYSTFVNINTKTFKPESVLSVNNFTGNKEYTKVRTFAEHLKNVQSLFNHKDVKNKHLSDDDVSSVQNYFQNVEIQKGKSVNLEKNTYDIYIDMDSSIDSMNSVELKNTNLKAENTISLLQLFDKSNLTFFIGNKNYLCKDSFTESNYFITSEYKNIHNFTFGGYLAYLSFCHAFTVIKRFLKKPILIGINEIQYILPVPYNSTVLYKGKVVYSNEKEIYIKICAYFYDVLKNVSYLTTVFDLSFQNNEGIAFIPQSNEEVKLFLFSHMRSLLIQ